MLIGAFAWGEGMVASMRPPEFTGGNVLPFLFPVPLRVALQ